MSAAQKAEMLRFAMRGVELDEQMERFIGWAGQMWDLTAIEVCCSMIELAREASFVAARTTVDDEPEQPPRQKDTAPGRIIESGMGGPGW